MAKAPLSEIPATCSMGISTILSGEIRSTSAVVNMQQWRNQYNAAIAPPQAKKLVGCNQNET